MSCESALRCSAIGSSFAISKHNALQHRVTARLVHVLGAGAAGAVVGSALFGQAAPEAFGAFDLAFFTLFRITAGEYPVEIAPAIAQGCNMLQYLLFGERGLVGGAGGGVCKALQARPAVFSSFALCHGEGCQRSGAWGCGRGGGVGRVWLRYCDRIRASRIFADQRMAAQSMASL